MGESSSVPAKDNRPQQKSFCECKWKGEIDHTKILPNLKREAEKFLRGKNFSRVSYQIVAKSFRHKVQNDDLILTDLFDL